MIITDLSNLGCQGIGCELTPFLLLAISARATLMGIAGLLRLHDVILVATTNKTGEAVPPGCDAKQCNNIGS